MIICPNCGEVHRDDQKFCKNCGQPLKSPWSMKKKLIVCAVVILIVVIAGLFVMTQFFEESDEYNNPASALYINNDDIADESVNTSGQPVQFKKVDFNNLFRMDVFDDSNYAESTPQFNATYQWEDSVHWGAGCSVYYYNQYDDVDQLESVFKSYYPNMSYSLDGDLFIFTDSDSSSSYVGVKSPNNEFVIVGGVDDIDTQKTFVNSIEFN